MIRGLTKSARGILLVGGLLYLGLPALVSVMHMSPTVDPLRAEAQREARNQSAFALMLGEFRASLSDLIFIKTERYLDRGVGYEPHVDTHAMASGDSHGHGHHHHAHGHHHDHDHDHDHDHGVVRTLIKTADEDFRGFIGHLERSVKPWRSPDAPHDHADNEEMSEVLPWYRLATLSNPSDVRSYYIGAYWLKTLNDDNQRREAVRFLGEGISANPTAYELYLMRGMILNDLERSDDAREDFGRAAELGIKRRPPGGASEQETPEWDTTNDELLVTAIGLHVMMTRDQDSTASAQQVLSGYQRAIPDEPALRRMDANLRRN